MRYGSSAGARGVNVARGSSTLATRGANIAGRGLGAAARFAGPAALVVGAADTLGQAASDHIETQRKMEQGIYDAESARSNHQNQAHHLVVDSLLGRGTTAAISGHLSDGVNHCRQNGASACASSALSTTRNLAVAGGRVVADASRRCHAAGALDCASNTASAVGGAVVDAAKGIGTSLYNSAGTIANATVEGGRRFLRCGFWASASVKAQCAAEEAQEQANRRRAEQQRAAVDAAYHELQREHRELSRQNLAQRAS